MSKITIFTSTDLIPTNLSKSFDGWTNRSYQHEAYGIRETKVFDKPTEARHVAIVNQNSAVYGTEEGLKTFAILSLAEVKIFGDLNSGNFFTIPRHSFLVQTGDFVGYTCTQRQTTPNIY